MTIALALVLLLAGGARGGDPVFDPSTLMRLVLVPSDAAVGSVIYRVRASDPDFDYPLHFELIGKSYETGKMKKSFHGSIPSMIHLQRYSYLEISQDL